MASALLRDPEMAATQLFPPSMAQWHQGSLSPLEHDLPRARELLAEAGWVKGPDGVLARDGRRFEITLRTFPDRPELPILATAIQDALRKLGIALEVEVGNSSEIPAGHQDGSLELGLYARNYALVPDPLVTLLGDFDRDGDDWGAMGWRDDTLSQTLRDLAQDPNRAGVEEDRRSVAQILQRELPVIPVAWYRQSAAVSDRLDGFSLDPLERSWQLADLAWTK
jgi:peptide/nickel transport system substrate-binding protein